MKCQILTILSLVEIKNLSRLKNMTNKEKFLNLVSEHDSKTMEDVKRRVKYRKVLNMINIFKIKLWKKRK